MRSPSQTQFPILDLMFGDSGILEVRWNSLEPGHCYSDPSRSLVWLLLPSLCELYWVAIKREGHELRGERGNEVGFGFSELYFPHVAQWGKGIRLSHQRTSLRLCES